MIGYYDYDCFAFIVFYSIIMNIILYISAQKDH